MDRDQLVLFLDLLENSTGDWLDAFRDAGREAFGLDEDVARILCRLNISDPDAEVFFQHLAAAPAVLAAYLRPRLLGTRD